MPVESATYIADLNQSYPTAGDLRSQGDDHLRRIKEVLLNTFPGASKPFRLPDTMTTHTSATYTVVTADFGKLIPVNATSNAVAVTLPTSPDAGFHVIVMKTDTSVNNVTVGSSQNINGDASQTLTWAYDAMLFWYGNSTWYGMRLGRQLRNRNVSSTNLDDLLTQGEYDGTSLTNAPGSGWWHIQVYSYSQSVLGSNCLQVATDLDTAGGSMYYRTRVTNVWGSWIAFVQLAGANAFTGNNTYSGTSEFTKQANFTPRVALTDAASISWNLETAQVAYVTLGGNRALAAPTNMKDGGTYILFVLQDGTGSRTLTYNSVYKWPGGTTPTLSTAASSVDILTFVSNGTNMYGVCQKAFS